MAKRHPESIAFRRGFRDGQLSDTGPDSPYFADSPEHEAYIHGFEEGREADGHDDEYGCWNDDDRGSYVPPIVDV